MNRKGLEEKKNDLIGQMTELLDGAKQENRELSGEEVKKFDDLEREIKEINEKIKKEEEEREMENKEVRNEVEVRESKQFVDYVRSVIENRADVNLASGNNGAIIPKTIAKKVIAKAYDMSSILNGATHYNTKGDLAIPQYGADGSNDISMAYANEFADLESKVGKFTSVDLGNYLAGALVKIGKSLVANTDIDLEAKVIELMAEAIARFEEKECLVGTSGKVQGLSGVTLAVTAGSATAITADELIKVKNKIKKRFRKASKWIMSSETLTAIELLKDGEERFIFREDLNGEFDGYLLGYPVEVSDNMPDIAGGKTVIYFGDFSGLALKQRNDALEMQVLREKYATQHAIGITAWLEFDAKVENAQKIAKLTMGA
jgi:HK97 family phage major capsid protein